LGTIKVSQSFSNFINRSDNPSFANAVIFSGEHSFQGEFFERNKLCHFPTSFYYFKSNSLQQAAIKASKKQRAPHKSQLKLLEKIFDSPTFLL
jgi:hypothetical protein